ncbi:hypothetical protein MLD38_008920 [Melastoma candidum]|uniref:Uncharacterized protein n=1 Tax=Melastoma candidum TaxID=119954 RepID=A0ACB9RVV2_9MYRT|nr:hypothetical protein MLD38_008920 [Melastoma candidum]
MSGPVHSMKIGGQGMSSPYPIVSQSEVAIVPVIDISGLRKTARERSLVVKEIGNACGRMGFFQVVNHRIGKAVMEGALEAASAFFELPEQEKRKYESGNLREPVRYGTGLKDGEEVTRNRRFFIKHYAHPLEEWITCWPANPPNYREKMGEFSTQAREVGLELLEAITESLGLGPTYLTRRMSGSMQVIAVNFYPRPHTPSPGSTVGLPAHSDYSCLTIVLPNSPGLEILDPEDSSWKLVPVVEGALQVHVGDHLEVLSNGIYKSVVHRGIINVDETRISIASLQSLAMEEKMEPAEELIDEDHPKGYVGSSYMDFLEFLYGNELGQGWSFVDALKIK